MRYHQNMRFFCVIFGILATFPLFASAQPPDDILATLRTEQYGYELAEVVAVTSEEKNPLHGLGRFSQQVTLRITTGESKGKELTLENTVLEGRPDMELGIGDTLVVEQWKTIDGGTEYFFREKYRLPSLYLLAGVFLLLAFLFGGRMGLQSILGLFVSILILAAFVVPQIIHGKNPLLTHFIGAFLIACTALYLAHGFSKKTSIALASTLLTLLV